MAARLCPDCGASLRPGVLEAFPNLADSIQLNCQACNQFLVFPRWQRLAFWIVTLMAGLALATYLERVHGVALGSRGAGLVTLAVLPVMVLLWRPFWTVRRWTGSLAGPQASVAWFLVILGSVLAAFWALALFESALFG